MKQIYEESSANDVVLEERAYQTWVKDEKNRILSMNDSRRKQEQWRLLFPQVESSDDWLLSAKVW